VTRIASPGETLHAAVEYAEQIARKAKRWKHERS